MAFAWRWARAPPSDVLRSTLAYGARLLLRGLILGIVWAMALRRFVAGFLFAISDRDPLTYAAAAMVLGGVAMMAVYGPARRAARVEPLTALRTE